MTPLIPSLEDALSYGGARGPEGGCARRTEAAAPRTCSLVGMIRGGSSRCRKMSGASRCGGSSTGSSPSLSSWGTPPPSFLTRLRAGTQLPGARSTLLGAQLLMGTRRSRWRLPYARPARVWRARASARTTARIGVAPHPAGVAARRRPRPVRPCRYGPGQPASCWLAFRLRGRLDEGFQLRCSCPQSRCVLACVRACVSVRARMRASDRRPRVARREA